jgi:hypothetical protein
LLQLLCSLLLEYSHFHFIHPRHDIFNKPVGDFKNEIQITIQLNLFDRL